LEFTRQDRKNLVETIRKDTQWLGRKNLIDYSLLIGIEKATKEYRLEPAMDSTNSLTISRLLE
jgi:hypothetical protein